MALHDDALFSSLANVRGDIGSGKIIYAEITQDNKFYQYSHCCASEAAVGRWIDLLGWRRSP